MSERFADRCKILRVHRIYRNDRVLKIDDKIYAVTSD